MYRLKKRFMPILTLLILLMAVIFAAAALFPLPVSAAVTEHSANVSDISFAGLGKASSFYVSSADFTADVKNLLLYHLVKTDDDKYETILLTKVSKSVTENGYIIVRDAKFTKIPAADDMIVLKNSTDVFAYTVTQSIVSEFTGTASTPAPTPVVKASGTGDKMVFSVKSPAKSTVYFYSKSRTHVGTVEMGAKSSLSCTPDEIFGSNLNSVLTAGMFYVLCTSPDYGTQSSAVPVYFAKADAPLAPTPAAKVSAINTITITAKNIANMEISLWAYGTNESSSVNSYVTFKNANTAVLNFDEFMNSQSILSSGGGIKKIQFSLSADDCEDGLKSGVLSINYIQSDSNTPANVRNESSPVVIKNNLGSSDQIIVGELPKGTKILLFTLTNTQVASTRKNYVEELMSIEMLAGGKYADTDSSGNEVKVVHSAYIGKTASAKKDADTIFKFDLAPYVGHTLFICIIPAGETEAVWLSDSYVIPSEKLSQTTKWGAELSVYYVMGMTNDNLIVYGAKKNDILTLYSSATGKSMSVTVADNYALFTKISMADGYDQIGISRAGCKAIPRALLNLPTHNAGTVSDKISITLGTVPAA